MAKRFVLRIIIKINSTMQIAIDYKDPCLLKKMKSRSISGIVKK